MARSDLLKWEDKHNSRLDRSPSSSLTWLSQVLPGSLALDLACGQGRNASSLTSLGYTVIAADISRRALAWLHADVAGTTSPVFPLQCDFDEWCFAPSCFDLVVQCDFLDRSLFPFIKDSLRPAGLALIDTFSIGHEGAGRAGPSNPAYRLEPGELAEVFAGWDIIGSEENDRAAILARKPARL